MSQNSKDYATRVHRGCVGVRLHWGGRNLASSNIGRTAGSQRRACLLSPGPRKEAKQKEVKQSILNVKTRELVLVSVPRSFLTSCLPLQQVLSDSHSLIWS